MRNKIKVMIAVIAISISFTACKHQIDQSVIQSFTNENMELDQKVSDMKAFKIQTITVVDKKKSDMIASIDPKKKVAYEKDNDLKLELNEIKDKMDTAFKVFEKDYNFLDRSIENNTSFISEIPTSDKDEEDIKLDWQQNMAVFNAMVVTNEDLQKEIINLSQQYDGLIQTAIKKYGKTEATKNIKKKKK